MDLKTALRLPEFTGLSNQQALDHGNENVVVATDNNAYTWSGIGQQLISHGLNPALWFEFNANLPSIPGGPALFNCLNSGGFDFANPTNRALIQGMEVSEPTWAVTVLDAMLAIGQSMGSRWQLWGIAQPTLQDIDSARASNVLDDARDTLQSRFSAMMNEIINPLLAAHGTTWEQIQVAVAGASFDDVLR